MNKNFIQEIIITEDVLQRVDLYLASKILKSRSSIQSQIKAGMIIVNGESASPKTIVCKGDIIGILDRGDQGKVAISIPIIFENEDIIAINKPIGISTHPAPGEKDLTVYDYFKEKFSDDCGDKSLIEYPLIVHRLDKGTSGIMLLAKNFRARESLLLQFKNRQVKKHYIALLTGDFTEKKGRIDLPIERDLKNRGRFAVTATGKNAVTRFDVVENVSGFTLVSVYPETGRTHQIRVHFSALGFPLVGDKRYYPKSESDRIFLHAYKISFKLPNSNDLTELAAPIPESYLEKLVSLGFSPQVLSKLS